MHEEDLKRLLRLAEDGLEHPPIETMALMASVRDRARKGKRRRRTLVLVVPLCFCLIGMVWLVRDSGKMPSENGERMVATSNDGIGEAIHQIEARETSDSGNLSLTLGGDYREAAKQGGSNTQMLEAGIAYHLHLAQSLQAQSRLENARREVDTLPSEVSTAEVMEVTAYRMLLRADALLAEMQPREEAIAIYRNVVRLYSKTHSAQLARQRLSELGIPEGDV